MDGVEGAKDDADAHIDRVRHLPPAGQLLPELLRLLDQPNLETAHIIRLISLDPGLTANVLRVSNAVRAHSATAVISVEEALVRLGLIELYRIVAAATAAKLLHRQQSQNWADPVQLWEHSVTTAVAAQIMARDLGENQNLVFTAGLLHDLGRMILAESVGKEYIAVTDLAEARQQRLLEAERAAFGLDHAEVGARLLERWNFPAALVAAVRFHHEPGTATDHSRVAACVSYANLVAHLVGYGYGDQPLSFRERAQALELLHLSPDCLPGYMVETYGQFEAIRSFFSLGI